MTANKTIDEQLQDWEPRHGVEQLRALLDQGANVDGVHGDDLRWPLLAAAKIDDRAAIDLLLSRGARLDGVINKLVSKDRTSLIRYLFERGADPNFRLRDPYKDQSVLDAAIVFNDPDAVRLALEFKADVHSADVNGWTPLHRATELKQSATVRVLLAAGARADARSTKELHSFGPQPVGTTPLDIAKSKQIHDMLEKSLGGAKPSPKEGTASQTPPAAAPAAAHGRRRFEFSENGAGKFWFS